VKVTFVPAQIVDPELLLMLTEAAATGFTVMVMLLLATDEAVTQFSEEVSVQETMSPLFNAVELNVLLFVPALLPFTFHW